MEFSGLSSSFTKVREQTTGRIFLGGGRPTTERSAFCENFGGNFGGFRFFSDVPNVREQMPGRIFLGVRAPIAKRSANLHNIDYLFYRFYKKKVTLLYD